MSRKLGILCINQFFYPDHAGGVERVTHETVRRLVARGHSVDLVGLRTRPGTPDTEVIDGVRGRIWRREVGRQELAELADRLQVISSRLQGGRTMVHVYSPERPDDSFEAVEPDLKDVYFSTLKRQPQAA